MTSKLFIHVPLSQLRRHLPLLTAQQLQPEIACHDVNLDTLDLHALQDIADELHDNGLLTTLHAPFSGFSCGSERPSIKASSQRIVDQTLELARQMKACRIVFHPGLDYGSSHKRQQQWLEASIPFWRQYLAEAQEQGTVLCIENIWETHFEYQLLLLQELASDWFGHVFDIGHYHLFSKPSLSEWLSNIGPYIRHLHIHDNCRRSDDHLVLGDGNAPLEELYQWLNIQAEMPTVTLENRRLDESLLSLRYLRQHQPDLIAKLSA